MELDEWDNFTREEREEMEQFEASCREEPYEVITEIYRAVKNGKRWQVTKIIERITSKIIGEKREIINEE